MKDGTKNLDKLQKVDLRDVWPLEDRNFTPWLAEEENLKLLSETLNIDFEDVVFDLNWGSLGFMDEMINELFTQLVVTAN